MKILPKLGLLIAEARCREADKKRFLAYPCIKGRDENDCNDKRNQFLPKQKKEKYMLLIVCDNASKFSPKKAGAVALGCPY